MLCKLSEKIGALKYECTTDFDEDNSIKYVRAFQRGKCIYDSREDIFEYTKEVLKLEVKKTDNLDQSLKEFEAAREKSYDLPF